MQSEPTFNISDVSQQTGVAAVTLRAWERRYGLIRPQRTAKGHRVYSYENIEQIQQVLSWLNRGVSISKVAALLKNDQPPASITTNDEHWLQIQQELLAALIKLNMRSLNPLLDKLNKSTPFLTLCEFVYQPLHGLLLQRWQEEALGFQLEQQIWQQCWQRQIMIMTLRADKQKPRGRCYLANIDIAPVAPNYWLLQALLIQEGIQVTAIDTVSDLKSLLRLNTEIDRLLLFADQSLARELFNQLLKLSQIWQGSIICAGRMADIHRQESADFALDFAGGNASESWQSSDMKAWLAQSGAQ